MNDISDRNEAELLAQTELYVKRDALPNLEDESEFYVSDLEGKQVKAVDGTEFGLIVSVVNFGAKRYYRDSDQQKKKQLSTFLFWKSIYRLLIWMVGMFSFRQKGKSLFNR